MRKLTAIPALLLILFTTPSCKKKDVHQELTSGRIDYKITYLNDDLDKKTLNILPTRMKLTFNEKMATNNIDGFMGMYKLNAITHFNSRKCSTLLKVFEKHYIFKGVRDEQMCCFDTMDDMLITETDETKMIAGFTCKKAIVYLPSSNRTFTIFYTEEINLKHPNSTNPYHKIDGVLMEFELNLLYLRMRMAAEKYQPLVKDEPNMKLPDNCRKVSREQMTQILNKLME